MESDKIMSEYIISVKKRSNEWVYASVDNGAYGSGYPCWSLYHHDARRFNNIEQAENWFDNVKDFLLHRGYTISDFDMDTLGIRKIIYEKMKSLNN